MKDPAGTVMIVLLVASVVFFALYAVGVFPTQNQETAVRVGGGVVRVVDDELGNVCYVARNGISCLNLYDD